MNPTTAKSKWKKNASAANMHTHQYMHDDFPHEHITRPKEKLGKRKFKIQREVDDYLASLH